MSAGNFFYTSNSLTKIGSASRPLLFIFLTSFLWINPLFSVEEREDAIEQQEVVVKEGDTIWGFANFYLKDPLRWPEILKLNNLSVSDPKSVLPGLKLKVPVLLIKEHLRAAYIIAVHNEVNYRRNKQIEWNKANLNIQLYNEDAVKTGIKSAAQVKFHTGDILKISESTLVVLRPEEKREEVHLLEGDVRASRARVISGKTVVEPKITAKTTNPDFRTKIRPDKTTLIAVYDGEVSVAAEGKTVDVPAGFGTEVKLMQPPSLPLPLPPLPKGSVNIEDTRLPELPSGRPLTDTLPLPQVKINRTMVEFELPPEEKLTYTPTPLPEPRTGMDKPTGTTTPTQAVAKAKPMKVEGYHIQVAKDTKFRQLIVDRIDKVGRQVNFNQGLTDGEYYWRVAYVDALGFESDFSQFQAIIVDTKPPLVTIIKPQPGDEISDDFVHVIGKTEKGISVIVQDKLVEITASGEFDTPLLLPPGKHKINVTARDKGDNTVTQTIEIVKLKPAGKELSIPNNRLVDISTSVIVGKSTATVRKNIDPSAKPVKPAPQISLGTVLAGISAGIVILFVLGSIIF